MAQKKTQEPEVEVEATPEVEPLSAKEAATKLGTDARTLRKYLRSVNGLVGQGNRWAINPNDLDELKKGFEGWHKGDKGKAVRPTLNAPPVDEKDIDEVAEFDDNAELEELDLDDLETLS